MKKNIFKSILLLSAVLISQGCGDKLDISNPNRLAAPDFYQNEEQAVAAVDAVYNVLIIDGLYQRMTPVINDGRSDEISSRSPWPFLTGLSNFTLQGTDGANEIAWAGYYIMVLRANQALENVPTVPGLDEGLRDRLLGQAYFLRALAYFNLANIFERVPLLTAVPQGQDEYYPSNLEVTQEMVYNQVQADLELAIPLLPLNYNSLTGPDNGQVGRATKGAAQSLLGKVHLYQKRYAEAAAAFKQVIDSQEYALNPNYHNLFTGDASVEGADPERIFWAEFTNSTNPEFNWGGDPSVNWRQFLAVTPTYSRADFFDFYPTTFLYNEMRAEKTVDDKLDPRYHATILSYEPTEGYTTAYGTDWLSRGYGVNDYFIKKYTNAVSGSDPFTSGVNYHIIRYADVLLMYAECLANTSDVANAAKYVQMVRDRANLPDREAEFAGYTVPQFMNQLAHERVMELAIEGSRYNDLKRWGWLENDARLTELKSHDFEFNTFQPAKRVMPIPQSELDRNPNMDGNSSN
jgi:starch-binding outer membrane protein, SusD/RagB family